MKCQRIRLMISLVTLLTLCLTLSAGSVRAEGEEYIGEEYIYVPVEIKDIGGKLPEETSFLVTVERKDEADTVSPLPDKTETTLKPGETDEFCFERAAFTEPGDYLYTMKQEKATGDDNVITDEITYTITVRVVNVDNKLSATVDIRKDGKDGKLESVIFSNNDKRAVAEQMNQGNSAQGDSKPGNSKDDQSDKGKGKLFPPNTGEAFPYWLLGLLGLSALLGTWSIGRNMRVASARKEGTEQ